MLLPPPVRLPAEWEPQRAVILSWATYDHRRGLPVHRTQREIVRALLPGTRVELLVRDAREERSARRYLGDPPGVTYVRSPNREIWTRDFGPTFLKRSDGGLAVATYRFDFWSYGRVGDDLSRPEDAVDDLYARRYGLAPRRSPLVAEGGDRESNGRGTVMLVEAVERRRNPGWSLERIAAEHRRVLGAKKIVWIPAGGAEDDLTFDGPLPGDVYTLVTTGGHVDNVARFVDDRTILLAEVTAEEARRSPILAISRRRFEACAAALARQTDQDGLPFRVVRVPAPDLKFVTMRPGDPTYDAIASLDYRKPFPKGRPVRAVPAASYLNFLVSNDVVLVSRFGSPKDARVEAILREAFPGKRIIPLDTFPVNLGGGGIHCITQPVWR